VALTDEIKQIVAGSLGGGILALIGVGLFGEPLTRPDPFTGTQGRELERRIDNIENHMSVIEYRLDKKKKDIEELSDCCNESD
jgi:hypothetical protein